MTQLENNRIMLRLGLGYSAGIVIQTARHYPKWSPRWLYYG